MQNVCLFLLLPVLSQFSRAPEEEFLPHSGCTLWGLAAWALLSTRIWFYVIKPGAGSAHTGCTCFASRCGIHHWIKRYLSEITLLTVPAHCAPRGQTFCLPSVLNWKLASLGGWRLRGPDSLPRTDLLLSSARKRSHVTMGDSRWGGVKSTLGSPSNTSFRSRPPPPFLNAAPPPAQHMKPLSCMDLCLFGQGTN